MIRIIKQFEHQAKKNSFGENSKIKILISNKNLLEWIAVASLISKNSEETIIICDRKGDKLKIGARSQNEAHISEDLLEFYLSKNGAGYLLKFLLIYYRNGMAAVDHIDLEPIHNKKIDYITFEAEDFEPPISSDDVYKILGVKKI